MSLRPLYILQTHHSGSSCLTFFLFRLACLREQTCSAPFLYSSHSPLDSLDIDLSISSVMHRALVFRCTFWNPDLCPSVKLVTISCLEFRTEWSTMCDPTQHIGLTIPHPKPPTQLSCPTLRTSCSTTLHVSPPVHEVDGCTGGLKCFRPCTMPNESFGGSLWLEKRCGP